MLADLDLDVHTRWQVKTLKRIDRLGGLVHNVQETLVHAHFEVLARVLVLVGSTNHGVPVLFGGQRNWPLHPSIRALDRLNDLRGGLIQDAVVEGLQPDSN